MAEQQQVASIVIQQKSVFKLKDFYNFLYNLVESQGFTVFEDIYSREGENASFEWSCKKWVDDYVQYLIWIGCSFEGIKPVKVKRGEIVEPMEKVDVKVTIKPKIITDWQARWGTNPVTKFLKGLYDKYLFGPTLESRKKELLEHANLIANEIKSFFDLPRFM